MEGLRGYRAAALIAAAVTTAATANLALAADPLTVFKSADEWGTIQVNGPRTGQNGIRSLNVEGSSFGNFASTGTLRFYMQDVVSEFDAHFGAGQWKISNVNIVLTQNNAAFSVAGGMKAYWFGNDALAITNGENEPLSAAPGQFQPLGVSPLRYSAGANALDTVLSDGTTDATTIFGIVSQVDTFQFTETGNTEDLLDVLAPKTDATWNVVNPEAPGTVVATPDYGITLPIAGGNAVRAETLANFQAAASRVQTNLNIAPIASDLESGNDALSFLLWAEAGTAATYRGSPFGGDVAPRIYITAEQISAGLVGDTNNDGVVDLVDLNNVLNNFGATGASPGDDNGDGVVDLTDLNNVLNNFGDTAASGALSVVPEPTGLGALGLGLIAWAGRRRRANA